jgi:hypothetical protein
MNCVNTLKSLHPTRRDGKATIYLQSVSRCQASDQLNDTLIPWRLSIPSSHSHQGAIEVCLRKKPLMSLKEMFFYMQTKSGIQHSTLLQLVNE